MKPLCFVLMPFGKKNFQNEVVIDFDDVYERLIKPAVVGAGLEPIRADEEKTDGIIHKPMFERLVLCEYAVADLTTANPNVFYELGVRHAVKPYTTIMIFADAMRLPFDVALLRAFPYQLDEKGKLCNVENDLPKLREKITSGKNQRANDSPLFQLLEDYPNIAHEKTDVFRSMADYSRKIKDQLHSARESEPGERLRRIASVEEALSPMADQEAGVIIDLFLSYRSIGSKEGFEKMVDLAEKMPEVIRNTIMVQEQLGFALNRLGKREEAELVLTSLIKKRGGNSEVYGILGRVYKDRWEDAHRNGDKVQARGHLRKAIETYLKGFNTDWRDAYPGINAVTLMAISNPEDTRWKEIYPVVKYAVEQKMKGGTADYWDYATLVELSVIERNWTAAMGYLSDALANIREPWEPKTTVKNLKYILESRKERNENVEKEEEIIRELERA